MSGPIGEIAGKGAQGAIAKVGASILEIGIKKGIEFVKDRQAWADLFLKYETKYLERYGIVKLLGMKKGLSLDQVYTGVRILDDVSIRQFESLEALEKIYRERGIRRLQQGGCRLGEDGEPENGIQVANQYSCLMVLGGPGAGKSTFLRRIGLAAARGEARFFEHDCIPVMLELKQLKEAEVDLQSAVALEFANVGFDFSKDFVEESLQQGKLLVLFDGLDEVPKANQDKVIDAIQNFVNRYDNNRFMASCRVAAYRSSFQNFTEIELADFDDKQIKQFIHNWFTTDIDRENNTASQCWMLLNEDSQKSAKELAQTPLLLTFLCIYYDKKQSFAAYRATLYRTALDILLEEWAAEKRIRHAPVYEGLNTELEKVMLAEIAYKGFVNDQLFFTQQELLDQIKKFLEDSVDKPKYLDSRRVLDEIAAQQGILVERAEDFYSFSHLTLQEYLVAQHISRTDDADQSYEAIVRNYLSPMDYAGQSLIELLKQQRAKQRWQEVLLLVPGLLQKADRMLKLMHQIADQEVAASPLQALLTWTEQVTANSKSTVPPHAKRSIALTLAINCTKLLDNHQSVSFLAKWSACELIRVFDCDLNYALNLVYVLKEFCYPLCEDFDLALSKADDSVSKLVSSLRSNLHQVFNDSISFDLLIDELVDLHWPYVSNEVDEFCDDLPSLWGYHLQLDVESIRFSIQEVLALTNYLYINELMVRCKQESVRVSSNVWKEIESHMLLPSKVE